MYVAGIPWLGLNHEMGKQVKTYHGLLAPAQSGAHRQCVHEAEASQPARQGTLVAPGSEGSAALARLHGCSTASAAFSPPGCGG